MSREASTGPLYDKRLKDLIEEHSEVFRKGTIKMLNDANLLSHAGKTVYFPIPKPDENSEETSTEEMATEETSTKEPPAKEMTTQWYYSDSKFDKVSGLKLSELNKDLSGI